MQMMRTLGNVMVMGALALGSAATAATISTQSTAPGASRAQADAAPQGPAEQATQGRLDRLYSVLRITVTERPAWSSFAQIVLTNARTIDRLDSQRDETLPRMNAVQNMQSYAAITVQEEQDLRRAVPAFQTLYGELTPAQQRAADQQFATASTQSTETQGAVEQAARAHLDRLYSVLRITASEQPAWTRFAQTALANARALDRLRSQRAAALPRMNAVQNMQSYAGITTQREENLDRAAPAFQTLYMELTPSQRQAADQQLRTFATEHEGAH